MCSAEDGTARKSGYGVRRVQAAPRGVRINDEFHSMNNGLANFPEEERSQADVGPKLVLVHIPDWDLAMHLSSDTLALALQVRCFSTTLPPLNVRGLDPSLGCARVCLMGQFTSKLRE
jgi:hypothetical protein